MATALAAGLRYFLIVFAIGFALGTLRTLLVAPRLGELAAVALELPVMLAASWWVCGRLVRRLPSGLASRAVMGGSAFAMLIVAELTLAVTLFGRAPAALVMGWQTPAGLLGLIGLIGFGVMPLIRRR